MEGNEDRLERLSAEFSQFITDSDDFSLRADLLHLVRLNYTDQWGEPRSRAVSVEGNGVSLLGDLAREQRSIESFLNSAGVDPSDARLDFSSMTGRGLYDVVRSFIG